jgi:phage-related protein
LGSIGYIIDRYLKTVIIWLCLVVGSVSGGWGDSRERLRSFPADVRSEVGQALYQAELGEPHPSAAPMRGLNAVEIVSDFDGNTFRGVYTTKFKGQLYVLHCFQKKSRKGIKTPKGDVDLIKQRLRDAEQHNRQRERQEEGGGRGKTNKN